MKKYHVNPETGRAGACSATFNCPFGDLETEHYASAAEARAAFEKSMEAEREAAENEKKARAAKRLGAPILTLPARNARFDKDLSYALDYDYSLSYNHPPEEDICRCSTIVDVEIFGWRDNGEGLANYAKGYLALDKDAPLPSELQKKLAPFVTHFDASSYEEDISGGYYGEELNGITGPAELYDTLNDYYYSQSDSAGPENILIYLRGKGYDTTGERPLEAIKGALQAENEGRISAKVRNAKKWRIGTVSLASVATPSESQTLEGESNPRELDNPFGRKGPNGAIAGVVLEIAPNRYELVDGYHRRGWLKANHKKKAQYVILSKEEYREPSPYYWRDSEPQWHGE